MFWNLILEPGKRYSSTIHDSFHLSMAALDVTTVKNDKDICPVLLKIDGKDTVLCNLNKTQFLQVNLDHMFERGSKVTFYTTGKATIHLTGYLVQDEFDTSDLSDDPSEDSSASSDEEVSNKKDQGDSKPQLSKKNKRKSDAVDLLAKKKSKSNSDDEDEKGLDMSMSTLNHTSKSSLDNTEDDDDSDDDDDLDDDDDDDLSDDDLSSTLARLGGDDDLDDEDDDDDDDDDEEEDDSDSDDSDESEKVPQKQQKTPQQTPKKKPEEKTPNQGKNLQKQTPASNKKQNKQNQSVVNGATPKSEKKESNKETQQSKQGSTPQKRTLAGGVFIEELKSGNGPVAKPGKMVAVYYTGRLKTNNRVFDQSNKGPGFKFRLGKGEVIKGWDVGISGMTVGSKRRITCPAAMAYGSKGSLPDIPPNAVLVFDVELKSVN